MRHNNSKVQLNRFSSWRKATFTSLARNLLIYESIRIPVHRAKAVKPLVEKLISLAKANTLAAKRRSFSILGDHKLVSRLFNEIGPRFKSQGGFTRVIGLGKRRGDNADMVIFELTEKKIKELKRAKKEKGAKTAQEERKPEEIKARPVEEKKPEVSTGAAVKEKHTETKKPAKKFFGGLRKIFKKERDSL